MTFVHRRKLLTIVWAKTSTLRLFEVTVLLEKWKIVCLIFTFRVPRWSKSGWRRQYSIESNYRSFPVFPLLLQNKNKNMKKIIKKKVVTRTSKTITSCINPTLRQVSSISTVSKSWPGGCKLNSRLQENCLSCNFSAFTFDVCEKKVVSGSATKT